MPHQRDAAPSRRSRCRSSDRRCRWPRVCPANYGQRRSAEPGNLLSADALSVLGRVAAVGIMDVAAAVTRKAARFVDQPRGIELRTQRTWRSVSCCPQPSLNRTQAMIEGWFQRHWIRSRRSISHTVEASGDVGRSCTDRRPCHWEILEDKQAEAVGPVIVSFRLDLDVFADRHEAELFGRLDVERSAASVGAV